MAEEVWQLVVDRYRPETDMTQGNATPSLVDESSTITSSNDQSRFLQLPAELRNRIYDLCIQPGVKIATTCRNPRPRSPALMSVCRQIRQEFSGLYYACGFIAWCSRDLQHWLRSIGADGRRQITSINAPGVSACAFGPNSITCQKKYASQHLSRLYAELLEEGLAVNPGTLGAGIRMKTKEVKWLNAFELEELELPTLDLERERELSRGIWRFE